MKKTLPDIYQCKKQLETVRGISKAFFDLAKIVCSEPRSGELPVVVSLGAREV